MDDDGALLVAWIGDGPNFIPTEDVTPLQWRDALIEHQRERIVRLSERVRELQAQLAAQARKVT